MKKMVSYLLATQAAVLALSLALHKDITLLNYINNSFYIASLMLLVSLLIYTINSGFFDNISKSFRQIFAPKGSYTKKEKEELIPLSEIISVNSFPLAMLGLINLLLMLIALAIYYL
ncbi:DUF3899 domain-containing protein [Bacillus sp. FJAT-27251]|uniref:DUF3899 domain-containing protein n=1 Tax=Bacillus sp. FJAT-27251 TaxID=1684142 RepID=UPI0006A7DCB5|nr:DUF3899 domain-containing protein [Bacillus sp. FJAT-27251]